MAARAHIPWATLVLAPLIAYLFGVQWYFTESLDVPRVTVVTLKGHGGTKSEVDRSLQFKTAGSPWDVGVPFDADSEVAIDLQRVVEVTGLTIQADSDDMYQIAGSSDGQDFQMYGVVNALFESNGLQSRSTHFQKPARLRYVKIIGANGDGRYSVSGLTLQVVRFSIPCWVGILALDVVIFIGILFSFFFIFGAIGSKVRSTISTWDPYVACVSIFCSLIRPPSELLFGFLLIVCIYWLVSLFRTFVKTLTWKRTLGGMVLSIGVVGSLYLGKTYVEKVVGRKQDLSIDHRLVPDGHDINRDQLRFRGNSDDIAPDDFTILFMGDSFTYGLWTDYENAYPYQFESILKGRKCLSRIRVINFAWPSSSPILGLRLLKQIGKAYRPDLVLYNLDMTDYDDDLRYAKKLREQNFSLEFKARPLLGALAAFPTILDYVSQASHLWRTYARYKVTSDENDSSRARFFPALQPLELSTTDIELGVMTSLQAINDFTASELKAKFALILYPRSFQYSARESPLNWEKLEYPVLGPHVGEVFKYFEKREKSLPYPVFSTMKEFQETQKFPLFLESDPHWNKDGHTFMASIIANKLLSGNLVPCSGELNNIQ